MDLIIAFIIWRMIKVLKNIQNLQLRRIKIVDIYRGRESIEPSICLIFRADVRPSIIIKEGIRRLLEFQPFSLPYRTPLNSKISSFH